MLAKLSPLANLQDALAQGETTPFAVAEACIRVANGNSSRNTYLHFSPKDLLEQAQALSTMTARPPLWGVPISLKDCFDLAGTTTTCGSRFYARQNKTTTRDSAMAGRLKAVGALITGKTHLHQLAYGITGQSRDYGDCLQPRDAALLTGGSSSGAVASVQEGSALAAIGTDTGGSIRVPAALGGLTGYRASHSLASDSGAWPQAWDGAAHLAASFDTVGFVLRDPRDVRPIAEALFGVARTELVRQPRIGLVARGFLDDCEADVLVGFDAWLRQLGRAAQLEEFEPEDWGDAREIFAPIQACEAAELHRGHFDEFEAPIAERLKWGASLGADEVASLRARHTEFRDGIASLFARLDLLVMPSAPITRLLASDDHSATRARLLRYTAPFSLAGSPVLGLPGELIGAPFGTGVQVAAAPGKDAALLAFATALGGALVDDSLG
jgi:Asp-tRNA(Asn)/Glu-tRNA(Gln) amidotransferase A subunit family amidase